MLLPMALVYAPGEQAGELFQELAGHYPEILGLKHPHEILKVCTFHSRRQAHIRILTSRQASFIKPLTSTFIIP
jgi:hypothetical protein